MLMSIPLHFENLKIMDCYRFNLKVILPEGEKQPIAFRVMKLAYDYRIRGECGYNTPAVLEIQAEGSEKNLRMFAENIRNLLPLAHIDIGSAHKIDKPRYMEFDLSP